MIINDILPLATAVLLGTQTSILQVIPIEGLAVLSSGFAEIGSVLAQQAQQAASAAPAIPPAGLAALGVGLAGIGTGIAQRGIGAAAVGAYAEDSASFGVAILLTVIPETIIIISFVTIFLV